MIDFKQAIENAKYEDNILLEKDVLMYVLSDLESTIIYTVNSDYSKDRKINAVKYLALTTFGRIYDTVYKLSPRVSSLGDTLFKKNLDYGDSFSRGIDLYGAAGMGLRISDKVHRLENLTNRDNLVSDESVEDTLVDVLGYLVLIFTYNEEKYQI